MIDEIKNKAYLLYGNNKPVNTNNVFDMLNSLVWDMPEGINLNQSQVANWNLELSDKSCLGRVVKSAVLAEKYFPECSLIGVEVHEDELRNKMLELIHSTTTEESMLQETLLYEEPHSILAVNNEQFEPLSSVVGWRIKHSKIQKFPLWEEVTSSWLVSKANLTLDPFKKMDILNEAEEICPGTMLVAEVKVGALILISKTEEAIKLLQSIISKRMTARSLFCLWLLTDNNAYLEKLNSIYTFEMLNVLKKEAGIS